MNFLIDKIKEDRKDFKQLDMLEVITAIGIASKEFVRKDIDKIFDKDRTLYIKAYKNSAVCDMRIIMSLEHNTMLYTERVLGIIEDAINTKEYGNFERLFKLRYKKIYNNFKNKKKINNKDLISFITNGFAGDYEFASAVFYYNLFNKIDMTDLNIHTSLKIITNEFFIFEVFEKTNYSDGVITSYSSEINALRSMLGLKKKAYSFNELLDDICKKDIEESEKKSTPINRYIVEKQGPRAKYIGAMEGYFKYLNIFAEDLSKNVMFTQREIDNIFFSFILCIEFNSITAEEDLPNMFIAYLYMYLLNKEYMSLKKDYTEKVNEDYLAEVDNLKKDLMDSKFKLDNSLKDLEAREKVLAEKEKEKDKEILLLKKEIESYKESLSEYESLKNEVIKLRNIVFDEKQEGDSTCEEIDIFSPADLNKLHNLNIVIVGGAVSWIKKMKEVLPNWTFINTDSINTDFSLLKGADFIMFNTKMSHSLYFKAKSIIDKNNLTYDYINTNSNIDISIKVIKDVLNKNNLVNNSLPKS